ncbi:MAG: hypothetical protein JO140_00645 [Candidatus Eremiobacteraeota bacterium]|nr:hypothetical protein [Candidatus Eremiobacteraeota bacterium]
MHSEEQIYINDVPTLHAGAGKNDSDFQAVVRRGVYDYIGSSDALEVRDFVRLAAVNAIYKGDGRATYLLKGLINGPFSFGEKLKWSTALLLHTYPYLIPYFPMEFSRGVVDRVAGGTQQSAAA